MKAIMSPPTETNPRNDEDVMPRVEVIAKELQEALRLGVKESPLLTFAVAGALGYMLGGGLCIAESLQIRRPEVVALGSALDLESVPTEWLSSLHVEGIRRQSEKLRPT